MTLSVFISSTLLDFKEERRKLHRILTSCLPVACQIAEYLTPKTPNLQVELQRWIDDADIVILLLGERYGSSSMEMSWTEREIAYAISCKKKIMPYIRETDAQEASDIARKVDMDTAKQEALKRFIEHLEHKVAANIPRFASDEELIAFVVRDVCEEVIYEKQRRQRSEYENSFDIDY